MPRPLTCLLALVALLCAAPLYAQDDNPLVGSWVGIEMDGEPMPEGEFNITFNADGTGAFSERGFDADPFTYTYGEDGENICTLSMEDEDSFSFAVTVDGDTATFTPTGDGPPPLKVRRVDARDGAGDDAEPMPELEDMSDSPLVGRWELVSFNGEALPDGQRYVFHNHPDGTGTSTVNGEPADPYTWHHDFETGVATFTHPDQDPAAFTFVIEGDVATYTSTDGEMTIVERRVRDDAAGDAMPEDVPNGVPAPEPGPIDMSDSPLVGRWMLVQFNGEPVPADVVVYEHRDDGFGTVIESGEEGEGFRWRHDMDRGEVWVEAGDGQTYEFSVVLFEDLAVYFSKDRTMRIVHRRVSVGDAEGGVGALAGTWHAVSMDGHPSEPGEVSFVFNDDGTGELHERGEATPLTLAYDPETTLYSIRFEDEAPIRFSADIDGDQLTFTPTDADGPPVTVFQRAAEDEGEAGANEDDGAMDDTGVVGVWYAQKMEGEWVPADKEFRIEFRDDGTAAVFEDGEPDDEDFTYSIDEDRRVIQIFEDGDLEVEVGYELFDDVMFLTLMLPEEFRDGSDDEDMQMIMCRRPEGNEEHQRHRAAAGEGGGEGAAPPRDGREIERDLRDAAEDMLEEIGGLLEEKE